MLTPQQVEQFETDGYLVLDPCLEEGEVEALRRRVRQIAEGDLDFPEKSIEYEPGACERRMQNLRKINGPSQHDPFFVDHARHPRLLGAIVDLLGPDVKLFGDQKKFRTPKDILKI